MGKGHHDNGHGWRYEQENCSPLDKPSLLHQFPFLLSEIWEINGQCTEVSHRTACRGPRKSPKVSSVAPGTSAGSEQKAHFSVPLIIFANGFSHVYILISLAQVTTSLVTRMRWSLTSEASSGSSQPCWSGVPAVQAGQKLLLRGQGGFPKVNSRLGRRPRV